MDILTPQRRALLQQRLDNAEMQYDLLMTGQAAKVFVDQNGERIEYVQASAARLAAYILDLKRQLGIGGGMGPLNVWM